MRQLRALGFSPQVVRCTDDNRTLRRVIGVGLGVAIVPETAVDTTDNTITIVRDIPELPPFLFGLAWHAECPEPSEFIRCAIEAARSATIRLQHS